MEIKVSEKYVLGAYWGPRQEPVERCAERLSEFLRSLHEQHSALERWYLRAPTLKKSLQRPLGNFEIQTLTDLLMKGQNRENANRTVSDDLGFQLGLWNGEQGAMQASLSVLCGLCWASRTPSVSLSNCVVLDLPKELGDLAEANRMIQLLAATARAWNPDWAGVMSEASMLTRGFDAEEPFVDWMIYVPRRIEKVAEPSFLLQLEVGSIIIVQPDPPSATDLQSLAHIERVGNAIQRP